MDLRNEGMYNSEILGENVLSLQRIFAFKDQRLEKFLSKEGMKYGEKTIKILKKIRDASSLKIHTSLIQDTECT